ncbi:MAG: IPT/TIG domain-containing protein [bacterium]|jgi:uncharacterized protein (TIGR03437 family)
MKASTRLNLIWFLTLLAGAFLLLLGCNGGDGNGGVTPPPDDGGVVDPSRPSIFRLVPNSGPGGTEVIVQGSNFGAEKGTSVVTFNGVTLQVKTGTDGKPMWSDTSITVTIPTDARTGLIVVTKGGKQSYAGNNAKFTVTGGTDPLPAEGDPRITAISPSSGPRGNTLQGDPYTVVLITGENFGENRGSSTVRIGGALCDVVTKFDPISGEFEELWSNSNIEVAVPIDAPLGPQPVVVEVGGKSSNTGFTFTVEEQPSTARYVELASISPMSASVGETISIYGKNFGNQIGASYVTFDGKRAPVVSWSNTLVKVNVPDGAETGEFKIVVNEISYPPGPFDDAPMDPVIFVVVADPEITGVSPVKVILGDKVTLFGQHFGYQPGKIDISMGDSATIAASQFDGSDANYFWSNSQVTFIMPHTLKVSVNPDGSFKPGSVRLTTSDGRTSPQRSISVKNAFEGGLKASYKFFDPVSQMNESIPTTVYAAIAGVPITFDAFVVAGEPSAYTYEWNFGDGGTGTGAQTAHAFSASGIPAGGFKECTPTVKITHTSSKKVSLFVGHPLQIGGSQDTVISNMAVTNVPNNEPSFDPPLNYGGIERLGQPNLGKRIAHLGDTITLKGFNFGAIEGRVEIERRDQLGTFYYGNLVLSGGYTWSDNIINFSVSEINANMTGNVRVERLDMGTKSVNSVQLAVGPRLWNSDPPSPSVVDEITFYTFDTEVVDKIDWPGDVAPRKTSLIISMPGQPPFIVEPVIISNLSISFDLNSWKPVDNLGRPVAKTPGTWSFYIWSNALVDGKATDLINSGVISQPFTIPIS